MSVKVHFYPFLEVQVPNVVRFLVLSDYFHGLNSLPNNITSFIFLPGQPVKSSSLMFPLYGLKAWSFKNFSYLQPPPITF